MAGRDGDRRLVEHQRGNLAFMVLALDEKQRSDGLRHVDE